MFTTQVPSDPLTRLPSRPIGEMPVWRNGKEETHNEFSGGNYLGPLYVGRDFTVVPPRQPERALHGLPPKSPVFTGREADLTELLAMLRPDSPDNGQPRVVVVSGLPGVGKTELAVQAAHAALENGWFSGGVLFIDVQGYDPERAMAAGAALDGMLRAVGVPAEHIPPEEHRPRLFASVMAEYAANGSPVLVVIDNVASAEVAEPLLQSAGATLVTSRHTLADLHARRVELGELSDSAAVELLADELRRADDADTRVTDQQEEALSIAGLCGKLPLALHIVAALLTEDSARPLSSMVRDLCGSDTRLDEMRYRDATGERAVRSAFDLSYRQLDAHQARVLRLLPVNLGEEISTEAVAAMADLDVRTARWRLQELRRAHLITKGSSYGREGRWRMHDLVRLYVSGLPAEPGDMTTALVQLLAYYLDSTWEATRLLNPAPAIRADNPFDDRTQALEWLDAEYSNLIPFGRMVVVEPESARTLTADLFLWLWRYFELRRHTDDWISLTTHALTIARALGDRGREGEALTKLSGAFRQARRFNEAIDGCRKAIDIWHELGDRRAEGIALNNLAAALVEAKRYDEALVAAHEALTIWQETGDRHREGIATSHLGSALMGAGQQSESITAFEKAADIYREVGDKHAESLTLTNLGLAMRHSEWRLEDAIALHRRSAEAMMEADDQYGKGRVLVNLCATYLAAGQLDDAITAGRDAVALLQDGRDRHALGGAHVNLGMALLEEGRAEEAAEAFSNAASVHHDIGDLDAEIDARLNYGNALEKAGRREAAIDAFRATADMCRDTADRRREGQALGRLGHAIWEAAKSEEAITTLREAATISRAAGELDDTAKSLMFLGEALLRDRTDEAVSAFNDAIELLRQAGSEDLMRLAVAVLQGAKALKRLREEQNARLSAGRFEEEVSDYLASSVRQVGDRDLVGIMAADLGSSLRRAGRSSQAISVLEEAVAAFHEACNPDRERLARAELHAAQKAQLDARTAADALEHALRSATPDGKREGRALRVALDEAYQHLGPHDARFFRLLSANPGPEISLPAAAILVTADQAAILRRLEELSGLAMARNHQMLFHRMSSLYMKDVEVARGTLTVLMQMRLVEKDPANSERWRLPPAIQQFATQQSQKHVKQDMRGPMQTLLHLYYLAGAQAASASLDTGPIAPALHKIHGQAQSLHWLATEYTNLIATVHGAPDDDLGAVVALDLTRSLTHIVSLERRFNDAIALGPIARRAAQRLHDRHGEAVVLRNIGGDLALAKLPNEAITMLREALAIYQGLDDRVGEGTTLTNLGTALTCAGQFDEAADVLHAAIDINRRHGSSFSEAVALSSLGALGYAIGQLEEAITAFMGADKIYRTIGDQRHRAGTLSQLADTLRKAEQNDEAIKTYRRAATLARLTRDLPLATVALVGLAEAYRATGRQAEADDVLQEVIQFASDMDENPAVMTESQFRGPGEPPPAHIATTWSRLRLCR